MKIVSDHLKLVNSDGTTRSLESDPAPAPAQDTESENLHEPRYGYSGTSGGFIKLLRGPDTDELMKRPYEFILLTQIAKRAKRSECLSNHGLELREALMGDFLVIGLTRQNYRTALKNLKSNGLITTRVTNRGTIVKLINSTIFDINPDVPNHQGSKNLTNSQPSANHQLTTNKKLRNKEEKKTRVRESASVDHAAQSPVAPSQEINTAEDGEVGEPGEVSEAHWMTPDIFQYLEERKNDDDVKQLKINALDPSDPDWLKKVKEINYPSGTPGPYAEKGQP